MFSDKRNGKQAVLHCRDEPALIESSFVLFICPSHLLVFSYELHLYPAELGVQGSFTDRPDCQRWATSSHHKAGPEEIK